MHLSPMSQSEYEIWAPRSQAAYAEDKARANRIAKKDAESLAAESFQRLLPLGHATKDSYLFTAKDQAQNILGFIWFIIKGDEPERQAFICDVIIEEPHRGKGLGRQLMQLIETEIQKLGLKRIGLHVFGFNEPALNLYRSLGYLTTDLVMEKELP